MNKSSELKFKPHKLWVNRCLRLKRITYYGVPTWEAVLAIEVTPWWKFWNIDIEPLTLVRFFNAKTQEYCWQDVVTRTVITDQRVTDALNQAVAQQSEVDYWMTRVKVNKPNLRIINRKQGD